MRIIFTPFVLRTFRDKPKTKNFFDVKDRETLLELCNASSAIVDTEVDFIKHVICGNPLEIRKSTRELTLDVYPFIRSEYVSRTPSELPVLTRSLHLPSFVEQPIAKHLIFILYSREQLLSEFIEKGNNAEDFYMSEQNEYGVVAIMATDAPEPDPMLPITIMRNALGKQYGGNGNPINEEYYRKAVEFWDKNILIK